MVPLHEVPKVTKLIEKIEWWLPTARGKGSDERELLRVSVL